MKQDPVKEIQKIIAFLGLPCPELRDPSSAKFQHVLKESGIDAMKDYVEENYRTAFAGASETGWCVFRSISDTLIRQACICFIKCEAHICIYH